MPSGRPTRFCAPTAKGGKTTTLGNHWSDPAEVGTCTLKAHCGDACSPFLLPAAVGASSPRSLRMLQVMAQPWETDTRFSMQKAGYSHRGPSVTRRVDPRLPADQQVDQMEHNNGPGEDFGEDLRRQDRAGGNGEPSENSHGEICTRVGAELRRLSDQFHSDVMEEAQQRILAEHRRGRLRWLYRILDFFRGIFRRSRCDH